MRTPRIVVLAFLLASLPGTAVAASLVFEGAAGQTAGWKPVTTAVGDGTRGFWDRTSYDSAGTIGAGACSAASLVMGRSCDWVPRSATPIGNPLPARSGVGVEYYGLVSSTPLGADNPLDFYFTGTFDFDWTVLFQLTAWDEQVEFGWYVAGNPWARTPILGPAGPYTNNDGLPGRTGSGRIEGTDFGFYYRNTRFGDDVMFFTQSRFNTMGGYFAYLTEPQFGTTTSLYEDEQAFEQAFDLSRFQQFAVFYQGNRYWIGLEDQFGRATQAFCAEARVQPCSDYDFNDLMIAFDLKVPRAVPEPASVALVTLGVAGLIAARRRRR